MDGSGKWGKHNMICTDVICKIKNVFTQTSNVYFARTNSNERIDFKKVVCGEKGTKVGIRIKGMGGLAGSAGSMRLLLLGL